MNQELDEQTPSGQQVASGAKATWGWKLFVGALLAVLTFFWWLLIYSGGAVVHHG